MARKRLKRRKDGRVPIHRDGRYFYGKDEKDAEAKYNEWKRLVEAGLMNDMTVRHYAAQWLPLHKSAVNDNVYASYAGHLNRLIDTIGDKTLRSVTVDEAKGVYRLYEGKSQSTIRKARMLYIDLFDTAIENGYCLRNPFRSRKAQPDKGSDGSHRALTKDELSLIMEMQHPFRPAIMAMLYAGLRRGEALALDIDRDVDFDNNLIRVNYAIRYDSNQPILTDPKSEAGKREIALFSPLKDELKDRHGLLAPSSSGKLMSESAFKSAWNSYILAVECKLNGVHQKRWYGHTRAHKKRLQAAALLRSQGREDEARSLDLPEWKTFRIRPHDLRHTYCARFLRDAGVDIKQAMAWMGHADEKMILKIYDHLDEDRTQKSIAQVETQLQKLSDLLSKQDNESKTTDNTE